MRSGAAIIELVRPGAPTERDRLIADWLTTVLRWCARLGGPRVDAEEAAHDALLIVLDRAHTLRDPAALPAWVFGVTRRVLAQHRRRAWLRRWAGAIGGGHEEPVDEAPSAEARLMSADRAALVARALEGLSADHREVIVLCDLEERPLAEVALLLDAPLGTVKSRLSRAREAFARTARRAGLHPDGSSP